MVLHLSHAWRMANRAEHGAPFLPGVNSSPEIDRAIINHNPQAFRLAIGSTFQSKLDLFTQLLFVDLLFANRDLVDYANHARKASNRLFCIVAFAPIVHFSFERHPSIRYR